MSANGTPFATDELRPEGSIMKSLRAGSAVLGAALALACGPAAEPEAPAASEPSSAPAARVADAQAQAQEIFNLRCVTCHGAQGAGDGPGSTSLTPPPRNFTDAAWQASVSDEHLEQIIQYGGAAVGLSAAMPSNPDLTGKPEVLAALVTVIRGLGAK